ncbi:phospholipid phosphatase homolog 1.2 homolog isoform X2 [Aricia agestis]|uniref:phospholipid phosphatase homolog 1.2 homolog isoform X2 n=1 Tax=Aricia agestis TaxID=91739 RepID=UPI001C2076DA|nr:phospholipid phosphatase homolog 1.2 homolog isoform X2 [Aricia agestis]
MKMVQSYGAMRRKDPESQLLQSNTLGCNIRWALLVDLPIFVIVFAVIGLYELNVIPQLQAGFYCNDPKLSFVFNGDTVSSAVLMSSILLLPLVTVFVTELILYDSNSERTRLKYSMRKTLSIYRSYSYGLFVNFIVVEVMKAVSGSPRPIFFDVCQPDAALTCKDSEWVSSFKCTPNKYSSWMQTDSYHSFPSGHTSLSVLCGFFTAWYLQKRAFSWRNKTIFLVPLLQMLCISYSAVCSFSRITDHRHHWWDVLVGAIVGFVTLFYTVMLSKNFERRRWTRDRVMTSSQQTVQTFDGQMSTA